MFFQLALCVAVIGVAALMVRYIYQNGPRYAPVRHSSHEPRIGARSRRKSGCIWILPNTK